MGPLSFRAFGEPFLPFMERDLPFFRPDPQRFCTLRFDPTCSTVYPPALVRNHLDRRYTCQHANHLCGDSAIGTDNYKGNFHFKVATLSQVLHFSYAYAVGYIVRRWNEPETSQENLKLFNEIILCTRASRTWHKKKEFSEEDRRKSLKNSWTPGKRFSFPITIAQGVTKRRFSKSSLVIGIPPKLSLSQFSWKWKAIAWFHRKRKLQLYNVIKFWVKTIVDF